MASDAAEVLKQLSDADPKVKAQALYTLQDMGEAVAQLSTVAALVGDAHWSVRQAAVDFFVAMGARGSPQVAELAKLLGSSDCGVAAAAASALAGIGADAASEVPAIEALLAKRGEDTSSRLYAAAGIATKAPAVLRKPACAACAALGALGAAGAKAAPKVADCLNDQDAEIRAAAVAAIGAMGKEGAKYESKALELLQDSSPAVVAASVEALGRMAESFGPSDPVASAAADLFSHPHPAVRAAAARSLGAMGEEAPAHLEALVGLFHDTAPSVRCDAMRSVARCGDLGQMYASHVCRLAQDRNPWVRVAACETLARMGERGACFEEEIQALLYDTSPEVYDAAALALEAFAAAPTTKAPAATWNSLADDVAEEEEAAASPQGPLPTSLPVALLFPGQGSQYLKMLQNVKDIPAVADMLTKAKEILGWDLLELCLNGPEEKLEMTKYCQPVLYVGGLAGVELLRQDKPELVDQVRAVAGLSLGEYTALTFAGVFDFETGLRLVKLRGEAMQEAAEASAQLMVSVAGLDQPTLEKLCRECTGPGEICTVANFLFPKGFACAGSKAAMEKLIVKAQAIEGCLQAKALKTGGAFHTKLMEPAQQKLLQALKEVEPMLKAPKCEVYMNVTGKKLAVGTPPSAVLPLLAEQLCSCVLWEPCMKLMIADGITEFYECGPMKQLTAMMKRIDAAAWKRTTTICV